MGRFSANIKSQVAASPGVGWRLGLQKHQPTKIHPNSTLLALHYNTAFPSDPNKTVQPLVVSKLMRIYPSLLFFYVHNFRSTTLFYLNIFTFLYKNLFHTCPKVSWHAFYLKTLNRKWYLIIFFTRGKAHWVELNWNIYTFHCQPFSFFTILDPEAISAVYLEDFTIEHKLSGVWWTSYLTKVEIC